MSMDDLKNLPAPPQATPPEQVEMSLEDVLPPKEKWAAGPWQSEPDRAEWKDDSTGYPCLMRRSPTTGAWCGYVAVPSGHPWHGKDIHEIEASVHGGLTYADACHGEICHKPAPGESDDVWWLGFDCGHAFDEKPAMSAFFNSYRQREVALQDIYRDMAYVKTEVEHLARQAKEAS